MGRMVKRTDQASLEGWEFLYTNSREIPVMPEQLMRFLSDRSLAIPMRAQCEFTAGYLS